MVHGGGITFAFRLHEESGAPASEIARAYAAARDIFAMRAQWAEIEALDNKVAAEVQVAHAARGAPAGGARVALAAAQPPPAARHRHDRALLLARGGDAPGRAAAAARRRPTPEPLVVQADELEQARRPARAGQRVAGLATMFSTFDIVEVAAETGLDVERWPRCTSAWASA